MPIQPDSATADMDQVELAGAVGDNQFSDVDLDFTDEAAGDASEELGAMGPDGDLGMDGGLGIDGMPEEEPPTDEEILLERSNNRLFKDLQNFIKKELGINTTKETYSQIKSFLSNEKNIEATLNFLDNSNWNTSNLEVVLNENADSHNTLQSFIYNYINKDDIEEAEKKSAGVDQLNYNSQRGILMDKITVKDGVLVKESSSKEEKSSKKVLDSLSQAIRKAKVANKAYRSAKLQQAGLKALEKAGKKVNIKKADFGMEEEQGVNEGLKELAEAVKEVSEVLEDLKVEISADEFNDANDLLGEGEETLNEGADLLEGDFDFNAEAEDAGEEASEDKDEEFEEDKAATVMEKIVNKIAEIKKASVGPLDDAKEVSVKVNKEVDLKGNVFKTPTQDTKNKKLIGESEVDSISVQKNPKYNKVASQNVTPVELKKAVAASIDKARLSVEMAARQQLKGLLDNPLKQAIVNNLTETGLPEKIAQAIAHNSLIDGFEESQKIVLAEAFGTFIKKDYDEFVKIAKFTKDFEVTANFGDDSTEVEDSADDATTDTTPVVEDKDEASVTASLRPSPSGHTVDDEFTSYWNDVRKKYF